MSHKGKKRHFLMALKFYKYYIEYHHSLQLKSGRIPLAKQEQVERLWKLLLPLSFAGYIKMCHSPALQKKTMFSVNHCSKEVLYPRMKSCQCNGQTAQILRNMPALWQTHTNQFHICNGPSFCTIQSHHNCLTLQTSSYGY